MEDPASKELLDALLSTDEMSSESLPATMLLRGYLEQARRAMRAHRPLTQIGQEAFGLGIPGVLAVFAMRVRRRGTAWEAYWVVAGDPPPAVFPLADAPSPRAALEAYVALGARWAHAVLAGAEALPPLVAPATRPMAEEVAAKMRTIGLFVLPHLPGFPR